MRDTKLAGKYKPDGPADARAVQKLFAPSQIGEPDCTSEAGFADVVSHLALVQNIPYENLSLHLNKVS